MLPKGFQQIESPLADRSYVVPKVHQAFHHYLKVSRFLLLIDLSPSPHIPRRRLLFFCVCVYMCDKFKEDIYSHPLSLLPSLLFALQVVSTHYEVGRSFGGQKNTVLQYQMVVNSQVGREGGREDRKAGVDSLPTKRESF